MKIDSDNPELRHVKPNRLRVADLKFNTIRKCAIGFLAEKDRPQLEENVKFPHLAQSNTTALSDFCFKSATRCGFESLHNTLDQVGINAVSNPLKYRQTTA